MDAFREHLDDLEQQVADVAADVQRLERCTTDAVSFEVRASHDRGHGPANPGTRCECTLHTHACTLSLPPHPTQQELLGHCAALYHSNRSGSAALVAHLNALTEKLMK